jgi:hypothetical protein
MDPESKKLLEETFRLAQENNNMLRKVRSVQKWGTYWSLLKVLLIIGIALGSFYFLEPFVNKFISIWNNVSGSQQQNLNSNPVQDFFKKL